MNINAMAMYWKASQTIVVNSKDENHPKYIRLVNE